MALPFLQLSRSDLPVLFHDLLDVSVLLLRLPAHVGAEYPHQVGYQEVEWDYLEDYPRVLGGGLPEARPARGYHQAAFFRDYLGEWILEERVLEEDEDSDDEEVEKVLDGSSKVSQEAAQVEEVQEEHKEGRQVDREDQPEAQS